MLKIHLKRIIVAALLVIQYICCSTAYTQTTGKTSSKISLKQALKEITKAFDTKFVYEKSLVEGQTTGYDLDNIKGKNLEEVLKNVLYPNGLVFLYVKPNYYTIVPTNRLHDSGSGSDSRTGSKPAAERQTGDNNAPPAVVQKKRPIRGRVTDSTGAPLSGVSVKIAGAETGTVTNTEGEYSLDLAGNETLEFSYTGYATQTVEVSSRDQINIVLVQSYSRLNEVVVVGYGRVKKRDLTGSVASISSEDLTAFPAPGTVMALQGKTTGVQVIQNSGAPGAYISVRIRGGNSLQGNNEPLYVVDGFALSGDPNSINPNDILSIEVLKDASATAIYGSRGANGVVLITTKSGRVGRSEVVFNSYYSLQKIGKTIELMNAREFAEIANERAANDGFPAYFTADEINSFAEGTDWQKELFRTAPMQNHSITVNGGSQNTQYSLSGSVLNQDGIIPGSGLQRLSLRANLNQRLSDKFRLSYNSILTNSDISKIDSNGQKGGTTLSAVLVAPPTVQPFDESGNYSNVRRYIFSPNELRNPLAMAVERKHKLNTKYILAGTALTYEPIPNLSIRTSIGVESATSREDFYSTRVLDNTPTGSANVGSFTSMNILNENTVTYNQQIATDHELTVLGGVTYQDSKARGFRTGSVTGFLTDILETNNLQAGSVPGQPESGSSRWSLLSYLGRVNYSYKGTYLLTASMRADGSSRFGKGNKWGYFPSAAFAWRAINEEFMKGVTAISDLKLRVSWGITGSTAVDPYQTLNTLNSYRVVLGDQMYIGYAPNLTNLANPELKWETTVQTDLGFDLGLFRDRLYVTFDYYRKDTRDLLASVQLPTSSGYSTTITNVGKIRNTGIEVGINSTIIDRAVKMTMGVNFSKNKSKVIQLAGSSDVLGVIIPQPLAVAVNLVRVGLPIGVFYGYLEDGLDANGAIKYKDLSGDGSITPADRTIIGDPNPDFIYNLNSSVTYKNFELNYSFQGVQGADIFNVNLSAVGNSFYWGENQLKELYNDHWSPAKPDLNAKYPKISAKTLFSASDRYVEDGSFLRLRNVQLGYNFPTGSFGMKWIKSFQLYVSAQNLFTITDYSWYDPEINTRGGSNSVSLGIDNAGYPNAKTYTVGARLSL